MKKIFGLIAAMVFLITGLKAQSDKGLSLDEAINIAKKNRAAYLISEKEEEAAGFATKETRSGYTPKVTLDADIRYNPILATSIVPDFNNPDSQEKRAVQFGTPWQSSAGITLKQNILNPSLNQNIKADEIRQQIAQNTKTKSNTELVEAVSTSYYQVLLSSAAVDYSNSNFARWDALWKLLDLRQKEGKTLPTEVNTAYINKENARLMYEQDQQNVVLAKQYLFLQMGMETTNPETITLSNDLPGIFSSVPDELADTLNFENRSEYRVAKLNEALAEVNSKKEAKSILPTLDFVGYLGASGYGDKDNNITDVSNNWFGNSYLGIQLSVPFLDFSRGNRVEKEQINRDKARVEQNQWKSQIQYEILQSQLKVSQAKSAIEVRKKNLDIATFNEKVTKDRFAEGRALLTDVLDAENLMVQAQQQYLQSIYDFLVANLSLHKATGKI